MCDIVVGKYGLQRLGVSGSCYGHPDAFFLQPMQRLGHFREKQDLIHSVFLEEFLVSFRSINSL